MIKRIILFIVSLAVDQDSRNNLMKENKIRETVQRSGETCCPGLIGQAPVVARAS